ncbi:hypothetical protein EXIGLDRAFT_773960 [Exidia glandulosa HHB12029]|uniref:Uncharacterized protein n=1 Tax=Exidia glandulosa HHB12029 TaxID=1314781 RepID=A0A165ZZE6_EXIGL|nr:hypothetical protein EXIGLDRAFT_773960 [Exidia glandulosa HHB12029]
MSANPPTSVVSDEDLQRVGNGIIRDYAANATQLIFYGIYVFIICVSASILLRRRRRNRGSILLVLTMLTMFLISTFLWTYTTAVLVKRIRYALVDTSIGPMRERLQLANTTTGKVRYVGQIMFLVNCLIGDALLTWRVSTIYQKSSRVMLALVTTWLGAAVGTFGYLICLSKAKFPLDVDEPATCRNLAFSGLVISALLNAIAIGLLTRIAWQHRSMMRGLPDDSTASSKSKVDRVLTILVTSGAIYLVLFVLGNLVPYYLTSTPTTG